MILVAGLLLGYGFAAGAYRLPPFYQVAWLKNVLISRFAPPSGTYEPPTARSATVVETALQRLLVKRVALPNSSQEFVGGGALTLVGDLLYVLNSDGGIAAFDLANISPLTTEFDSLPLNINALMQSRERYTITTYWFRVNGAFAERVNDSTHTLFVAHNRYFADRRCFTFDVSRATVVRSGTTLRQTERWRTIFTSSPCMTLQGSEGVGRHPWSGHISGGKMIAFDASRLLVTVGDFNYDGYLRPAWSMDRSNPYGKFILLDKNSGRAETYAIGARNDMGLYRDSTGTIWATESGPQGGDELNIVTRDANYGWPNETYGIGYESTPWDPAPRQGRHDEHRQPVFAWVPSVVPTNIIRIEGHPGSFENWRGDLLIGSLRDQALHRLRLDRSGRVVYDERIPFEDRIRDLLRLPDGKIAVLTDATGQLIIIDDGGAEYEKLGDATRARLLALDRYDRLRDPRADSTEVTDGAGLFAQRCASCHAVDGRTLVGPPLNDVIGRRIGGHAGYGYSTVLATDEREWGAELLVRFLLHPETDFVNTKMLKVTLTHVQADSIIAYLGRLER